MDLIVSGLGRNGQFIAFLMWISHIICTTVTRAGLGIPSVRMYCAPLNYSNNLQTIYKLANTRNRLVRAIGIANARVQKNCLRDDEINAAINIYKRGNMPQQCLEVINMAKKNGSPMKQEYYQNVIAAFGRQGDYSTAHDLFLEGKAIPCLEGKKDRMHAMYNAMIAAFAKASGGSKWEEALALYNEMDSSGSNLQPTSPTHNSMLLAFANGGQWDTMVEWFHAMDARMKTNVTYRVFIDRCAETGDIELALKALEEAKINKLPQILPVYNAIINLYVQNGHYKASWEMYRAMQASHEKPSRFTYTVLLRAAAEHKQWTDMVDIVHTARLVGILLDAEVTHMAVRVCIENDKADVGHVIRHHVLHTEDRKKSRRSV
eukprot:CFRG2199T1